MAGTVLIQQRTSGVVAGVGALLATVGVGMVAGTLLLSTGARRWPSALLIAAALLGVGASLALFALARGRGLYAVALAAGVFVALLLISTEALIQRAVAAEARGRVFALRDIATRVGVLASAGLTGAALGRHWVSSAGAVLAAGVVVAIVAVAGGMLALGGRPRGAARGT